MRIWQLARQASVSWRGDGRQAVGGVVGRPPEGRLTMRQAGGSQCAAGIDVETARSAEAGTSGLLRADWSSSRAPLVRRDTCSGRWPCLKETAGGRSAGGYR